MSRRIINVGSAPLAGDGETLRDALIKVNDNFEEVYVAVENIVISDVSGLATEQYVDDAINAIEISDVSNFITAADIPTDFKGSVFADDSTLLVDGVNGKLVGNLTGRWEDDNGVFAITAENVAASFGGSTGFSMASNAPNGVSFALSGSGVFGPASFTIGAPGNFTATVSKEIQLSALEDVNISSTSGTINLNGDVVFSDNSVQTTAYTGYHTGDMTGSVFADNSTLLVDGVSGTVPGTLTGSWISPENSFDIIGDGLSVSTQNTALAISNNGLTYANNLNDETTAINISNGNVTLSMSGNITVSAQGSVAIASGPLSAAVNGEITIANDGNVSWAANGEITIANDGNVSWAANGDFLVAANNVLFNSNNVSANTFTGDLDGNIRSENSINIDINLTDSTLRRWRFGEDGNLTLPEGGDIVNSTGTSVLGGGGGGSVLEETFEGKTSATGVVEHDATTNRLFRHTSISGNFTANFTNLGLESGEATSLSLVLVQGATARMCTAVQIGGAAQTILWQGSASAPAGNANRTDVVTFSILCTATDTYTVLGILTSFGG